MPLPQTCFGRSYRSLGLDLGGGRYVGSSEESISKESISKEVIKTQLTR